MVDLGGPIAQEVLASVAAAAKYEPAANILATDREMKVSLVLVIMILAAATAYAYGHADVAAGVSADEVISGRVA